MTRLPAVLLAALAASPALADTDLGALVAERGLAGAEAALAALPDPTPSDLLALGGARVLRGAERALQLRWDVGMSDGLAAMSGLPLLRLPIPENPAPSPFAPAMVEDLFLGVEADMAAALDALAGVADDAEAGVVVDMGALWLDVDGDGARGAGEGALDVLGLAVSGGFGEPLPAVTVRFDTADAAWLAAYAHLLSAVSEAVLATAPAEAVGRVLDAREAFQALGQPAPFDGLALDGQFGEVVDLAAIVVMAVEGRPDPARTRALRAHLLAMVAENRRFWRLVARETDDEAEWIPGKRQASATGLPFPPDTGPRWLAVLAEAEAVLEGRLLVPHWRLGPGAGVDLAALLEDPPEVDLAGLIQGAALVPYMRRGPLASGRSLALFAELVQGDAALYAAMLN